MQKRISHFLNYIHNESLGAQICEMRSMSYFSVNRSWSWTDHAQKNNKRRHAARCKHL